jgi:hypothetical protein
MTPNIIEIRNYLLKPNKLEHFIDNFETNFIDPLEMLGMRVLVQFRLIGEIDHFVWLRGFEDMQTRLEGLDGFYSGPIWQKHRTVTNGMLLDNDDVHLLRPIGDFDLTCGLSAESVEADLRSGTISTDTGIVCIDIYQAVAGERDELIDAFQSQITPAYEQEGVQIRGLFVAEMSENTYPRLPVIQRPDEFVTFTVYENLEVCKSKRAKLARYIDEAMGALLKGKPESLLLSPTLRSALRYME